MQCGCPWEDLNFEWLWRKSDWKRWSSLLCWTPESSWAPHCPGGRGERTGRGAVRKPVSWGQDRSPSLAQGCVLWLLQERVFIAALFTPGRPFKIRNLLLAKPGPGLLFQSLGFNCWLILPPDGKSSPRLGIYGSAAFHWWFLPRPVCTGYIGTVVRETWNTELSFVLLLGREFQGCKTGLSSQEVIITF